MQVSAKAFLKRANELAEKVLDKDKAEHKVWIVLAPFCTKSYIIDARYLPGSTILEAERPTKPGNNNVQFLQGKVQTSPNDFSSLGILSV